jgi:hypothetical protein
MGKTEMVTYFKWRRLLQSGHLEGNETITLKQILMVRKCEVTVSEHNNGL